MFNKFNKIFVKGNFFFKKYKQKAILTNKGFYIEKKQSNINDFDKLLDKKNMVFWFLDLQKKTSQPISNLLKTKYNIQGSLKKGEKNFFELHGCLNFPITHKMLNKSLSKQQKKIFLGQAFIFLQEKGGDVYLSDLKYNGLLDFCTIAIKCIKNQNHVVIKLPRTPLQNRGVFLEHSFQKKENKYDCYINRSINQSFFDDLYNYINIFKYDFNSGKNLFENYQDFINYSNYQGRFKYLPTIVPALDTSISIEDGLGFQDFYQPICYEDYDFLISYHQYIYNVLFQKSSFVKSNFLKPYSLSTGSSTGTFLNNNLLFSCKNFLMTNSIAPLDFDFNKRKTQVFFKTPQTNICNQNIFVIEYNKVLNQLQFYSDLNLSVLTTKTKTGMENTVYIFTFYKLFNCFLAFSNFVSEINPLFFLKIKLEKEMPLNYIKFHYNFIKNYNMGFYNGIQCLNLLKGKLFFKKKHYLSIKPWDYVVLCNGFFKFKELIFLKMDVGRNFGTFLDQFFFDTDTEQIEKTKNMMDYSYNISEFKYKFFLDDIYQPFLTNPGIRPYKGLSISELQTSPFMFFFSNLKSFWFQLYNCFPAYTNITSRGKYIYRLKMHEKYLGYVVKNMFFFRYINSNDIQYNSFLKKIMSPIFFKRIFGETSFWQLKFKFFLDLNMTKQLFEKNKLVYNEKFKFSFIPNMLQPYYYNTVDFGKLFTQNKFINKELYGSDGYNSTEKRGTDQFRLSFLFRLGFSQSHFQFFSFMSPDFFNRAVIYKSGMKIRTLDKVPEPEHPLLILDFYRPHTYELTSDITLLKYKMDLLYMIRYGFDDVVFDKDIFVENFYEQPSERRDVLKMPEYTAPFFFFDSDLNAMTRVPTTPVYERVSAFGIPALDKQGKFTEFIVPFDSNNYLDDLQESSEKSLSFETLGKSKRAASKFMSTEFRLFYKFQKKTSLTNTLQLKLLRLNLNNLDILKIKNLLYYNMFSIIVKRNIPTSLLNKILIWSFCKNFCNKSLGLLKNILDLGFFIVFFKKSFYSTFFYFKTKTNVCYHVLTIKMFFEELFFLIKLDYLNEPFIQKKKAQILNLYYKENFSLKSYIQRLFTSFDGDIEDIYMYINSAFMPFEYMYILLIGFVLGLN